MRHFCLFFRNPYKPLREACFLGLFEKNTAEGGGKIYKKFFRVDKAGHRGL